MCAVEQQEVDAARGFLWMLQAVLLTGVRELRRFGDSPRGMKAAAFDPLIGGQSETNARNAC